MTPRDLDELSIPPEDYLDDDDLDEDDEWEDDEKAEQAHAEWLRKIEWPTDAEINRQQARLAAILGEDTP